MLNKIMTGATLALATAAALVPAAAQPVSYPVKNVTLVTHSSPGGGSDVFLRTLIKYLGTKMNASFAVENVRGGSGAKAVSRVATAPADGSVLYATTPTYIQTTLLSKPQHGYDSLMPVVIVFFDPEVLYARTESPHKDFASLIAQAKANPGKQKWGAANPASLERIAMERINRLTGARATIVSHEGGGDLMIGVLNGTYDLGIGEIQELRSQLEAKKVRLLASLTDTRLGDFPQLGTAKEQGVNLSVTKFRGLAGPKNLPPAVLEAWAAGIKAVLADPAYRKEYASESLIPAFMDAKEAGPFTARFAQELAGSLHELGVVKK